MLDLLAALDQRGCQAMPRDYAAELTERLDVPRRLTRTWDTSPLDSGHASDSQSMRDRDTARRFRR
jgi:hypothetical protein